MVKRSYGMGGCLPLKMSRALGKDPEISKRFTALTPAGRQGVIDAALGSREGWELETQLGAALDRDGPFVPGTYL